MKERYYSLSLLRSLAYDDDVNGNCDGMIDFTVIDCIGGADVEKVRHGEWIGRCGTGQYDDYYCNLCGMYEEGTRNRKLLGNYCPNCGAKMDGGKE